MVQKSMKTCTYQDGEDRCENLVEGRTEYCATHGWQVRRAAREALKEKKVHKIRKVSKKRAGENDTYSKKVKKWKVGKKCAVHGYYCGDWEDGQQTNHHMMGTIGYADEWARENDITLFMDERFWLPVCLEGHRQITDNPTWAWENKFSFKRVTDPIFRKNNQTV